MLTQAQKDAITAGFASLTGWPAERWTLTPYARWTSQRLPIFVGVPEGAHFEVAPKAALLPDGTTVTSGGRGALERIVRQVYPKPTAEDARELAQLTIMFGELRQPLGMLCTVPRAGLPASVAWRANVAPALSTAGQAKKVVFYTYDPQSHRVFDVTLLIAARAVTVTARLIGEVGASDAPASAPPES